MHLIRPALLALPLVILSGCTKAPSCTFKGTFDVEANAGCFIVDGNKALFIEDRKGNLALPGGTKKSGEAPQCTAERETWEETGALVTAGQRVHAFENGFHLYSCVPITEKEIDGSEKPWGLEVDEVHWLSADELDKKAWRFPEQVATFKFLLQESTSK